MAAHGHLKNAQRAAAASMTLPASARSAAVLSAAPPATARAAHGRLRIYFGASAGVATTHAMLTAARRLVGEGRDVVVGVVRDGDAALTATLVAGLECLPTPAGRLFGEQGGGELDLDAALARRPGLLLIDPLAHTNRAGMRHPKRWQDVEELLSAGIDVSTTLDVQNLESLNDVMGSITQERVTETVPDTVFDQAADVVMIDLPPDEVLENEAAQRRVVKSLGTPSRPALERRGMLLALRELALRRTADRV